MSLRDRLERLEATAGQHQESEDDARRRRTMDRFYFEMENARRQISGQPLLPTPAHLQETKEDHHHTLRVLVPGLRAGPGWTSDQAREILRAWEDTALDKLSELEEGDDE